MLIFDSTEIQYRVSSVRPAMTASIILGIYVANGGDTFKVNKQITFFSQLGSGEIGWRNIINNNLGVYPATKQEKTNHHALPKEINQFLLLKLIWKNPMNSNPFLRTAEWQTLSNFPCPARGTHNTSQEQLLTIERHWMTMRDWCFCQQGQNRCSRGCAGILVHTFMTR